MLKVNKSSALTTTPKSLLTCASSQATACTVHKGLPRFWKIWRRFFQKGSLLSKLTPPALPVKSEGFFPPGSSENHLFEWKSTQTSHDEKTPPKGAKSLPLIVVICRKLRRDLKQIRKVYLHQVPIREAGVEMKNFWNLELPGTCLSSILGVEPFKTRSFPIKTRVIRVLGSYNILWDSNSFESNTLPGYWMVETIAS